MSRKFAGAVIAGLAITELALAVVQYNAFEAQHQMQEHQRIDELFMKAVLCAVRQPEAPAESGPASTPPEMPVKYPMIKISREEMERALAGVDTDRIVMHPQSARRVATAAGWTVASSGYGIEPVRRGSNGEKETLGAPGYSDPRLCP